MEAVGVPWHCWDGSGGGSGFAAVAQRPKKGGRREECGVGDSCNNRREATVNMW